MKAKTERTLHELGDSLHTLRVLVKEVGGTYLAGLQSKVARLEQAVRLAREGGGIDRKQLQQMTTMLRWMSNLDVKPQKGRRKDLKAIEELIGKLSDSVDNW